jgi:hypothetical protein
MTIQSLLVTSKYVICKWSFSFICTIGHSSCVESFENFPLGLACTGGGDVKNIKSKVLPKQAALSTLLRSEN